MKFVHLLARIAGSAWCIRDEALQAILDTLSARMMLAGAGVPAVMPMPDDPEPADDPACQGCPPGVGLICVNGIIGKHLSQMETACGGCDLDDIEAQLEAGFAEPTINALVLALNTPGGVVAGTPELHDKIVALRAATGKKIYAFADVQCCSCGYYLASACDAIFCTGSSMVGAVGVKMAVRDTSAANAAAGVKFHIYKSGEFKDLGASYRAPTAAESSLLQTQIDLMGAQFRAAILAQRPQVKPADLEGQPFLGSQAVALGLVDETVNNLGDLFAQLMPATPALT